MICLLIYLQFKGSSHFYPSNLVLKNRKATVRIKPVSNGEMEPSEACNKVGRGTYEKGATRSILTVAKNKHVDKW